MPFFFLSGAFVFAADRFSKWLVAHEMYLHQDVPLVGDWVRLTYIHNAGAAFGLFQGSRIPLVVISILASAGVTWLALKRAHGYLQVLALGLILGGALGNLVDRLATGLVIDFINVGLGDHRWPVFNVADSAVTIGVLWLALGVSRSEREQRAPESTTDPA